MHFSSVKTSALVADMKAVTMVISKGAATELLSRGICTKQAAVRIGRGARNCPNRLLDESPSGDSCMRGSTVGKDKVNSMNGCTIA